MCETVLTYYNFTLATLTEEWTVGDYTGDSLSNLFPALSQCVSTMFMSAYCTSHSGVTSSKQLCASAYNLNRLLGKTITVSGTFSTRNKTWG